MTVPRRGVGALIDRVVSVLGARLPAQLAADVLEHNSATSDTLSITLGAIVPTATFEPVDRPNSILVGAVESEELRDQPYNYGFAVRVRSIVVVRAQVQAEPSRVDVTRRLIANAIVSVVHGYLMRDGNPAGCRGLPVCRILDRESSERQRNGVTSLRGAPTESPIDPVDVAIAVVHMVDRPPPL